MANLKDRIKVNPDQCKGRPYIQGTQIRVSDVLDLLAHGLTHEQILAKHPDLKLEDICACLQFASDRLNHRITTSNRKWPRWVLSVVALLWLSSCVYFFLPENIIPKILLPNDQTSAIKGQFGDSFGAVNALFSGLAFVGVIWAIMKQQEELELHRDDLQNTQEEMKEQRGVMQKEVFERSFFQLQQLLDEQYNQIEYMSRRGKDALYQAELDKKIKPDYILSAFISYFYLLFQIFEFVEQSQLKEQKFYINILCGRVH